jgi:hypothetical protein
MLIHKDIFFELAKYLTYDDLIHLKRSNKSLRDFFKTADGKVLLDTKCKEEREKDLYFLESYINSIGKEEDVNETDVVLEGLTTIIFVKKNDFIDVRLNDITEEGLQTSYHKIQNNNGITVGDIAWGLYKINSSKDVFNVFYGVSFLKVMNPGCKIKSLFVEIEFEMD